MLLGWLLYGASIFASALAKIPDFAVPDAELRSLVTDLRRRDLNKARPGEVRLNFQRVTTTRSNADNAPRNLFTFVSADVQRRTTYQKFKLLLDNYNRRTGIREDNNRAERNEVEAFLNAIFATDVIQQTYNFLHRKRHPYAATQRVFRNWLKQLWFSGYSRKRGQIDTSGFEHTMVGEASGRSVGGLHNWYQFYLLEKRGKIDYKGYLIKRGNIMTVIRYNWESEKKPSGSFLIGTSPEFDLALYTLCFLTHNGYGNICKVNIDDCDVHITSHVLTQNGKDFIGSIFPGAGRMNAACRRRSRRIDN